MADETNIVASFNARMSGIQAEHEAAERADEANAGGLSATLGAHQLHPSMNMCLGCDWRPIDGEGSLGDQHVRHVATVVKRIVVERDLPVADDLPPTNAGPCRDGGVCETPSHWTVADETNAGGLTDAEMSQSVRYLGASGPTRLFVAPAVERIVAERVRVAEARERKMYRLYMDTAQQLHVAASPWCVCEEGPYFGAQLAGTPLRCERCGKDETCPTPAVEQERAARLALVAGIEARAESLSEGSALRDDLRALLSTADTTALRERDAAKWDEGWLAGNRWAFSDADTDAIDTNPYRADRLGGA